MSLDESYPGIQLTTARKAGDLLTVTPLQRLKQIHALHPEVADVAAGSFREK